MSGIELEGWEDLEKTIQELTLTPAEEKSAMQKAIKPVAKALEANTPKGRTKRLSKVKTIVKSDGFSVVGIVGSEAFYDIFQNYGTSKQKRNVGYFDKAIDSNVQDVVNTLGKTLLK